MNLPLDPTQNDASPQELIQGLPSQAARRRVLQAAGISMDVDDRSFADALNELSQIQLRRAASQLQFAGARTVYYYRVDGLHQVSPEGATGRVGDAGSPGVYGSEVQTVTSEHDRIFVVCNVPETGSQAQLTLTKEDRPTTVATFKPRTQLLAVRAPDKGTADATVQAFKSYFELDDVTRVSFLDNGFRGRFEDACVDGYSTLRLQNTNAYDNTREIEVRSKEPKSGNISDVRVDSIVEDLLRRGDTELDAATGLVSLRTDVRSPKTGEPLHPRVTIGFAEGCVNFEQFVPEQILIAFDDVVRKAI
ncbi:hypothetical protein [Haloprofundus halobius]|uniref:hypothetical protein n=1 Tax=Haloprofundus halobius TaxID=2876194 RepID=UPI001CCD9477|nr:hypothetical protein [Haloprofundus halobius]